MSLIAIESATNSEQFSFRFCLTTQYSRPRAWCRNTSCYVLWKTPLSPRNAAACPQVLVERPGALRAAPVLPEHVRRRVGLHAARALRSEARSHSIQGSSLHA